MKGIKSEVCQDHIKGLVYLGLHYRRKISLGNCESAEFSLLEPSLIVCLKIFYDLGV